MRFMLAAAVTAAMLPFASFAAPVAVDLTGWTAEDGNGSPGSSWQVQAGNDTVRQFANSRPTVFFDPNENSQGTALKGKITRVSNGFDDDYIGFVLGYNQGEFDSGMADFWLIDWKQRNQGNASIGMALSHVTGNVGAAPELDFWQHEGVVNEVQRANNLGNVGYTNF